MSIRYDTVGFVRDGISSFLKEIKKMSNDSEKRKNFFF